MPDPTMSDAITEALDSLKPATPEAQEAPEAPEPATPEAQEAPEAPVESETPEEAAPETAEVEAEGAEKIDAEDKPIAAKEPVADPNKKPDHVNDPIPKELKEATQERIRSLVSTVKELQPVAETGRLLLDAMQDAQMSPEELDHAIGYAKLIKSDNIEDKRKGFAILMNELKALAPMIGESLPGTDPVAAHADLVQDVKDGKMTRERATELAVSRNREKAGEAATRQAVAQQQNAQQFEQARLSAVADLNALGRELAQNDPHFQAKYDAIVPALKVAFQNVHPSRWKTVFMNTYKNWKVSLPAPAAAPAPASPQPLRANKQPAGNGVKTPTTMAEAMDAAIAQASRR